MSKSLVEPTPERKITQNRFQIKDTRQKPLAFRWWEPGCTIGVDGCTGEEPVLVNSWAQPTLATLEKFAFRLHADGRIQFQGVPDASGGAASGSVLTTLPGATAGEVDFLPPAGDDLVQPIIITLDDGVTFLVAAAHIEAATGDITVTWEDVASPSSVYHKVADASTNPDTIKASPGVVTGYYITNPSTGFRYCKLYDKASNPTVGTDVPKLTLGIPPLTAANIGFDNVIEFTVGIAIAMTQGIADNDATAMAGNDMIADVFWR